MSRSKHRSRIQGLAYGLAALAGCFVLLQPFKPAGALPGSNITERSVEMSDNMPGHTSDYALLLTIPTVPTLGSIKLEFCRNSPLYTESCDPSTGLDLSGATLTSQSGDTGFSIDPSTTANTLILTRTPGASTGTASRYILHGVVNSTDTDTQYARYSTYASTDGSGTLLEKGALAYVLNNESSVSTEVPPYLDFCLGTIINSTDCSDISAGYLSLGDFSTTKATSGTLQTVVGTNAANGYMISVDGNSMASGANALPALTVPTASAPGNSQFGINLRANSSPQSGSDPAGAGAGSPTPDYNVPNKFTFRSGDVVASKPTVEDYRKYTITYLVNISRSQPAGIYAGTYTYVALGNF